MLFGLRVIVAILCFGFVALQVVRGIQAAREKEAGLAVVEFTIGAVFAVGGVLGVVALL